MRAGHFFEKHFPWILFTVVLGAHLWHINYGLPSFLNTDEPHNLNIAARFGTGDLNPHDFKYPTLWPYLIAGVFGFLFVVERVLGIAHSAGEFAQQYVCSPTLFYLSIRILSAVLISSGVAIVALAGKRFYGHRIGIFAGVLCALASPMIKYGRDGTPYNPMLFFLAAATYQLHNLLRHGRQRDYVLSGLFIGLAGSCHFTAIPAGFLMLTLHFTQRGRSLKLPAIGVLVSLLAFFAASPYLLLDFNTFMRDMADLKQLEHGAFWGQPSFLWSRVGLIFLNVARFMDPYAIGAALILAGLLLDPQLRSWKTLAWIAPMLSTLPALTVSYFGGLNRYNLCNLFPLILLAALGANALYERLKENPAARRAFLILTFAPLLFSFTKQVWAFGMDDIRVLSRDWFKANVPPGEKIFVTDTYRCPQFKMNKAQLTRLYDRTKAINHPREDYFRLLLEGCPDGGYEIFTNKKTVQEGEDLATRTALSYAAQDWLEPKKEGVTGFTSREIRYVVVDEGAVNDPSNDGWLAELKEKGTLIAVFERIPWKVKGHVIWIYRV